MPAEPPMMAGSAASAPPAAEETESSEQTSVFIPKDALGERDCKPGEKLTLTVKDVDADTGEVEAVVDGYSSESESPKSAGTQAAIDSMSED